jgi:hypothetical protein
MSQHEYSVNLAKPRTKEEILAVSKAFLEKKRLEQLHPPLHFRDTANGE